MLQLRPFAFLLAGAAFLVARPAAAQELQYRITDPNTDAGFVADSIGGLVDEQLKLEDQTEFLEQMAAATALSARGMGVDYASSPQRFVLGGSIGSALNGSGAGFGYGSGLLPSGGFAFQASVMGGLNLGAFSGDKSPMRRFIIYGHGMAANGSRDPFSARALNGGGHLQVQLLKVRDAGVAGWGGLAFTTGFEHTAYELTLQQEVPIEAGEITWNADGTYVIDTTTNSIPLELSTNMRAAFVTVFGGGGLDLMLKGTGDSDIDLYGTLNDPTRGDVAVGEALITYSDSADTNGVTPRFFGGLQFNIMMVKVYGQLNISSPAGFGGHAGARIAM